VKTAKVFAVPSSHPNGYACRWACTAGKTQSKDTFAFYYDCLEDAQRRGYEVETMAGEGASAPGGIQHKL
jgi:hypothetical protein